MVQPKTGIAGAGLRAARRRSMMDVERKAAGVLDEFVFTPIRDRVLIKPVPPEDMSEGVNGFRIHLVHSVNEAPMTGTVMAIGPDVKSDFKMGDEILHERYVGQDVELQGDMYVIVSEEKIIGVVTR